MNETQAYVDLQDAGNAQAQLVLQAIARHADWTTGECFPSQEELASMAKCTDRTVRQYLKRLEADGFIERERRKRNDGGRSSDLIRLVGYAEWICAVRQGGTVKAPKRIEKYSTAPPEDLSGTPRQDVPGPLEDSVPGPPGRQRSGPDNVTFNNQINNSAQAREDSKFGLKKIGSPGARSSFPIVAADPQFPKWIEWLRGRDRCDLADAANAAGELVVFGSKWPNENSPLPKVSDSGTASVRAGQMVGGAA